MAKTTSISLGDLGDHFTDFIEAQVTSGQFGSASEVVWAGLCTCVAGQSFACGLLCGDCL
ncbi:type II toxin-antitoxin system ParD family antitoxin [Phaeobacter inhibens]|uniref:type II toxin-antitoxin system ParD family antitoxin n=1 Tax=Phaeobacter inhibens TaxID=221822 RepID=UPI00295F113B|nr:type II toxin-antitoxin system ParD family antitoxin [Phaeobacter inhibens]